MTARGPDDPFGDGWGAVALVIAAVVGALIAVAGACDDVLADRVPA